MRRTTRTVAVALTAAALLLAGCAAQTPTDPAASTTAVVAPAGASEYGLPAGDGPVHVDLWTDLSCPYCRMLEAATGDVLQDAVAAGEITLTLHPLNFVSGKHGDETAWSTRAANALAATLDAGEGDALPAFYALLQENQTLADGESHPTDADILDYAAQAGVTADIADAVDSQRFGAWVQASNDFWLGSTISGTEQVVDGVPILVVDGQVLDLGSADVPGDLRDAILAAG